MGLADGQTVVVEGSGSARYTLKNSGGVYSCTCPAWRHQNVAIERRTCKHLRAFLGEEAEALRVGAAGQPPVRVEAPRAQGNVPALLLAHRWENDVDLAGWWLSEKLDGVRAYWDGERFISRLGNPFFAPAWFTRGLPKTPLDGELWGGRRAFQRTVGIVKRQDESELWREVAYVVFDAPKHEGLFEERLAFLRELVAAAACAQLSAVEQYVCRGVAHLREELARVEALGGEGLMLRQPRSRYEAGRSSTLLKVKSFHDAEARVVATVPGAGRHRGRMGALLVELPDGTRFNVGTGFTDAEREAPPGPGAIITFRYQELTSAGVPRFPSYVGERIDGTFTIRARPGSSPPRGDQMTFRRFERTEGDARYFWEIETSGSTQRVRFGTFEERRQLFEDPEEAAADAEKRVAEKLSKGFEEVRASGATPPAASATPAREEPAPAPAAAVTAAPAPARTPEPPAPAGEPLDVFSSAPPPVVTAPASSPASSRSGVAGTRYFEFVDGKSSKFWEVRVEGTTFFTRYGRLGTQGQVTQKDFDSPERAAAEAAKLTAEKMRKGYVER